MSKARGTSLQQAWKDSSPNDRYVSQAQKEKVVYQLGALTANLSHLRFDRAGSLFEEKGGFHIKRCLGRGLLMNERYTCEGIPRGPFLSEKEYYNAHLAAFIEHVKYLPLGHHCFFAPVPTRNEFESQEEYSRATDWWNDFVTVQSKIDGSTNRVDYIVAAEILAQFMKNQPKSLLNLGWRLRDRPFAIQHPDLSANNIYVDEKFNIICVIDWAFSSAVPLPILLTAPGLPQSYHELDTLLLPSLESGFRHGLEVHAHPYSADIISTLCQTLRDNRPTWLLSRLLNFESITDYHLLKELWEITAGFDRGVAEIVRVKLSSTELISLRKELMEDDQTAEQVAEAESRYFLDRDRRSTGLEWQYLHNNTWRETLARKLTLVSQWTSRYHEGQNRIRYNGNTFVADRRLWRWIDDCLRSLVGS
ncbi:MAG: hypothetical protein L6R39_000994 [Caloplaca ligustica]|nr:MAG: hypothetical protein L6R39_000994 [Caloplaca ligustica]